MKRRFICISIFAILYAAGLSGQCTDDCVWPGDANNNGTANHMDILALGLSWEQTGPPRTDPSVNWEPLDADNWAGALPLSGANFKHCDSDGNGEINFPDIVPITDNFGLTNPDFMGLWGNNIPGNDLRARPLQNTVSPGDTLLVNIELGSPDEPIENIYGIAFSLSMNSEYVENINMLTEGSWMAVADPDAELIPFSKFPPADNKTYIALSRMDGVPVTGFGTIARLEIVIVDAIVALELDSTECLVLDLNIENVLGIDEMENDLLISSKNDSAYIKHPSQITPVYENKKVPAIDVFPNPANNILHINSKYFRPETIALKNQFGQEILRQKVGQAGINESSITLSLAQLDAGVYCLELIGENIKIVRKIIVQ